MAVKPTRQRVAFLTEYNTSAGRLWAGDRIDAADWEEAENIASLCGVRVIGIFEGEVPASDSLVEGIRRGLAAIRVRLGNN